MADGLIIIRGIPASGSVSPLNPSPCREVRGIRLFRAISRKLARRSTYELDADSRSSSSDSCGSTSAGRSSRLRTKEDLAGDVFRSVSSISGSEAGSDVAQPRGRHHHSASAESIRKAFQSLNIGGRSQSCSTAKRSDGKKPPPKRILRQPVVYTYVRGLSGLPTQRVPRRTSLHRACGCGMQYLGGLHR